MTEYGFRNKVKPYVNLSPTDNYSEIDMVFRKKSFIFSICLFRNM